ncbi:hypothetical protein AB0I98_36980 [Streptomyces sp. NPDC050211]|uniref:hypothetical protein n=1 Tax=Streptomyces sp. NPDC050211 TaxID=3154932 RepID=UPI003412C626
MDVSCIERRIHLASGNYDWGHTREGVGDTVIRSNVHLVAGWYTWESCLYPFEDYYSQGLVPRPEVPTGHRPTWARDRCRPGMAPEEGRMPRQQLRIF